MRLFRMLVCLLVWMAATSAVAAPKPELPPVEAIVKPAVQFALELQADIQRRGKPLNKKWTAYARSLGIRHPERVSVLVAERFPMPDDPELYRLLTYYGFGSNLEGARSNGYGILLKPSLADNDEILAHELVHVHQAERMGLEAFIRLYLQQAERFAYEDIPLEQEAFSKSRRFRAMP